MINKGNTLNTVKWLLVLTVLFSHLSIANGDIANSVALNRLSTAYRTLEEPLKKASKTELEYAKSESGCDPFKPYNLPDATPLEFNNVAFCAEKFRHFLILAKTIDNDE